MDKLLVIILLKTLKDTVFIHSASETARMNFEADFGDLAGYMHLKFLAPTFKVFCAIPRVSLREVFVHISVLLGLIVHNDDVFRTRNPNSLANNILNIFRAIKLAAQLTTEEMKEILKGAVEYCYSNGMEISFTSPGWVAESFLRELAVNVPSCGACLSNMAVTPGGNVVPCQSWLSDDSLGNLLTEDWETIWNSDKCVERRKFSAKMGGECPLRKR